VIGLEAAWNQEEDSMETCDAIQARRNVRQYTPDPVPEQHLTRIVEAGWRAPSASNRQHWDFVVVTDRVKCSASATPRTGRCAR
jgi:nitroreductase